MSASGTTGRGSRYDAFAAVMTSLSTSVLGYNFLSNPEGFILAVIYRRFVDLIQSLANRAAYELYNTVGMAYEAIFGGIGYAIGAPGRFAASNIQAGIGELEDLAESIAMSLGPFGFVAIPLVWVVSTVLVVALLAGIWRLYKWIRVVVI